jgi:hypothetical protein
MDGLLLESLAAEKIRDLEREVMKVRRSRKERKVRRPAGSWVLSGAVATWLR